MREPPAGRDGTVTAGAKISWGARYLGVLCIGLSLLGCQEAFHASYRDRVELERAGPAALTWFPSPLPGSAKSLEVWYDLDTNRAFGRFEIPPEDSAAYRAQLQAAAPPVARATFATRSRSFTSDLPPCLKGRMDANQIHACGFSSAASGGFLVLLSPSGRILFWSREAVALELGAKSGS